MDQTAEWLVDQALGQVHRLYVPAIAGRQREGPGQDLQVFRIELQRAQHEVRRQGQVPLPVRVAPGQVVAVG